MRFLHLPSMYWRCECVCDLFTPGPALLCIKITYMMTKFEYDRSVLWGIAMRLSRYLSKRVHHIGEFDVQKARIYKVSVSQISPDKTFTFGCPQSSSPCRQLIYQIGMVNE